MRSPLRSLTALTAVLALGLLTSCSSDDTATDPGPADRASESPSASTDASSPAAAAGACDYPADAMGSAKKVDPPAADPSATGEVAVTISTSAGDISATLDAGATPCTVNSFLSLSEQGYFDDTQCHRLTTQGIFVLQCGDPTGTGAGGPGYSFDDELEGDETYGPGTLAMANAGPNTNGSQFFIVYDDSPLDPNYTVFGQLDEASTELVAGIAKAGTADGAPDGAPKKEVTIESVTAS